MTSTERASTPATADRWWRTYEVPSRLRPGDWLRLAWALRIVGPIRRRLGRTASHGPRRLDGRDVLERLAALPVSLWTYDFEPGVRHLGPMAQDFAAAFGLGATNRMIEPLDANGVTMVAVQALYRRVKALETEVAQLRRQVTS